MIMRYEAHHVDGLHSFVKSYRFVITLTFSDSSEEKSFHKTPEKRGREFGRQVSTRSA